MSQTWNESFWNRDVLTYLRFLILSVATVLVFVALLLPGALDYAEKECYKQTKISYNDCVQRNYDFIWSPLFWFLMMIPSFTMVMAVWYLTPSLPEQKQKSRSAV